MYEVQWIFDGKWRLIFITEDKNDAIVAMIDMRRSFPGRYFRLIDLYHFMSHPESEATS